MGATDESQARGRCVDAIVHVLELVADGELVVPPAVVDGLAGALDLALEAYAATDNYRLRSR